ncbi:T9SS type A sorting domain-containing protein [Aureispira anguillae]|uniref:T9SS type A sorting domain-containing protein n=1 Tax=Aureispira anguillae TaxID=2864201 RepID=A0A916DPI1_9BACT|nr:T9SS type A sorting domain-containing protein [Aureispira anguillae]BDS10554.1 T9SS type A sorting domain-containing protein [Aureispira anguillae]
MAKITFFLLAMILSFLGINVQAQQIPTQDLVVEYQFDNNLLETSGSSYNAGALTSTNSVNYVQGIDGNDAVSPNGEVLSNVGNIAFSSNVKQYVVSFWFKANASGSTTPFNLLELKDQNNSNIGLTVEVANNGQQLNVTQNASGLTSLGSFNSFSGYLDNNWHHIAVKLVYWPGGQKYYLRTYLDNVKIIDDQAQVSLNNIWVFGGLNIYIPSQVMGTGIAQDLKIDNFRFYEAPITPTQIAALYNEKNNGSTCAIINIPDANFKNALLDHGTIIVGTDVSVIDTDGDGEICQNEAQAYTGAIEVNSRNITDLTGIEAFVNIIRLSCNQNQLSNLDVSQNTALTKLYCLYNQLTSLDVSQNTALTALNCTSNQLTSLDVSQNTALQMLVVPNNNLSSLDVSQNTTLTDLFCLNNLLSSLNVANGNNSNISIMNSVNNTNLTCIQHDNGFDPTTNSSWTKDVTANWNTSCNTLDIEDIEFAKSISLYPNPASNIVMIEMDNLQSVKVVDMQGKEVLKSTNNKIDVSALKTGMYFVKITNNNGNIATKKLLKNKF